MMMYEYHVGFVGSQNVEAFELKTVKRALFTDQALGVFNMNDI